MGRIKSLIKDTDFREWLAGHVPPVSGRWDFEYSLTSVEREASLLGFLAFQVLLCSSQLLVTNHPALAVLVSTICNCVCGESLETECSFSGVFAKLHSNWGLYEVKG